MLISFTHYHYISINFVLLLIIYIKSTYSVVFLKNIDIFIKILVKASLLSR